MKKPKRKPKVKQPRMTLAILAKRLAAYHVRGLQDDLHIQQLTSRIDRMLAELEESNAFLDKLTTIFPSAPLTKR